MIHPEKLMTVILSTFTTSQEELVKIGKSSTSSNTALVNLLVKLQGYSTFSLKTNLKVYLSLDVWDLDSGPSDDDIIRYI